MHERESKGQTFEWLHYGEDDDPAKMTYSIIDVMSRDPSSIQLRASTEPQPCNGSKYIADSAKRQHGTDR